MKFYWNNCRKLKWWVWWLLMQMVLYPSIIIFVCYLLTYLSQKQNWWFEINFQQNYIEILTYISGFLFAWLSILLTNTTLKKEQYWSIWEKYKPYVIKFWWVENENCQNNDKIESWVKKWILRFKFSLLLDVLTTVVLSIISISLSIFWNDIFLRITKFLFVVCIIQLVILIPRIITYLKIIEFNIK